MRERELPRRDPVISLYDCDMGRRDSMINLEDGVGGLGLCGDLSPGAIKTEFNPMLSAFNAFKFDNQVMSPLFTPLNHTDLLIVNH